MTTKSILIALAPSVLAFSLLLLPRTTAEAVECYIAYDYVCTKGGVAVDRGKHLDNLGVDEGFVKCCKGTLPSEPYATGESEAEKAARHKQEAAQLKAACDKRGAAWQWDSGSNQCKTVPCPEGQIRREGKCQQVGVLPGSTTGKKGGFIQMKPNCAEGFVWSESANNCVASPAAEKQTSDDDDYKPQKKKKKKKGQYEDDGGYQKKKKKQRDYDDDDDGDRY